MKKKVLSQINAIAQGIVSSENEIDISKLKNALLQLYEKLTILEFLESSVETEFEKPERTATDSKTYREQNWFKEPDPVPQNPHEEELVEPLTEKIKDIVANMPNENEEAIEELLKEIIPSKETSKNDLEEFAASYTENPVFERKQKMEVEEKPKSINDNINSGLQIGLNDRIAFIKQLFNNSTDDYLRVLSQINSMDTFEEAQIFIQSKVRLDYNWAEKETYVDRFLLIIEKSFN
ncbi:MAG: hypothetical protein P8H34_04710 [Flavobacteriaceae bacterium]|nr:hypothetical protein [Flavobacteriaceae bacterium]MDG2446822.1 hypothetical protein [Flavobacteriaceae bacterium]